MSKDTSIVAHTISVLVANEPGILARVLSMWVLCCALPSLGIAFTRDYILHLRNTMAAAVQNWTGFDVAYSEADWSKYRDMPAFAANNRGNAYRIYLELEQSQFKADKP